MAQKRALVAAVLVATGASAYFTQDVEDFPGYRQDQTTHIEISEQPKAKKKKTADAPENDPNKELWQTVTQDWQGSDWFDKFWRPTIKLIRGKTNTSLKDPQIRKKIHEKFKVESMKDFEGTRGDVKAGIDELIESMKKETGDKGKVEPTSNKGVNLGGNAGVIYLGRILGYQTKTNVKSGVVMLIFFGADEDTGELDPLPICEPRSFPVSDISFLNGEISQDKKNPTTIYDSDFDLESIGIIELKWHRDQKDQKNIVIDHFGPLED
jgi:hypothetical protein